MLDLINAVKESNFGCARIAWLLLALAVPAIGSAQSAQTSQPKQIHIRVINATTNQPISDERLNVALREDQVGSVAMGTDKKGIILVDPKDATIVRILSNMYADCRPRGELYTNYRIETILSTGITTGNLCSSTSVPANPGELVLYEVPKTYIRKFPHPPVDTLPHSQN